MITGCVSVQPPRTTTTISSIVCYDSERNAVIQHENVSAVRNVNGILVVERTANTAETDDVNQATRRRQHTTSVTTEWTWVYNMPCVANGTTVETNSVAGLQVY